MAAFSALYPYARSLLGDIGQMCMYSNTQLDAAIRMGLLEDSMTPDDKQRYSEDPAASGNIAPEFVTDRDKLRIVVRTALAMVKPSIGVKAYRSPVMQVHKNQAEVIAQLLYTLRVCTGEDVVVDGSSDLDTWLWSQLDFITKLNWLPGYPESTLFTSR